TPVAGRGEQVLDDLVGMFVNTLVLRTTVEPEATFDSLLDAAREADLSAFTHADMPFEQLVDLLDVERSTAYSPLFQVMFTLQNNAQAAFELPGLTVSGVPAELGVARFDLQLTVADAADADGSAGDLDATFTYATDLFDSSTVAGFAEMFTRVLS
ncbi:condensation domain-containing protein, partial [Gordonia paraffinivorans]|uniref:condensation domain-containing protein n=1 Tax=Gordonia paraffinivorans TaxID=175628 RepID=UPI001445A3AE